MSLPGRVDFRTGGIGAQPESAGIETWAKGKLMKPAKGLAAGR
tara:strand:+ start:21686 stop:21814 length:129 start_codon:yes stop_codon:yes gene_type:complete